MFKSNKLAVAVSAAVLSSTAAAAEIEEVTVTATKRAQSVTEIPYNISAMTGDTLERQGITDMAKLTRSIPGVAFTDKGPRSAAVNNSVVSMRGLNVSSASRDGDRPSISAPSVATYINDTPVFAALRLKDIERVEVMRGPQGTLYGSGAMGGAIRMIQKKPQFDEQTINVSASLSKNSEADDFTNSTDVIFNVPISDTFAIRGNIGRLDQAGFIDSPRMFELDANGVPTYGADILNDPATFTSKEDTNDAEVINGRLAARWEPSESTEINLSYHFQRDEADGRRAQTTALGDYKLGNLIDEPFERDLDLVSLDVEVDMGFATMTAALSHYESEGTMIEDSTGPYENYLEAVLGSTLWSYYYGENGFDRYLIRSEREFSDDGNVVELRLVSNDEGDIDWLVGLFYMKQDTYSLQDDYFPGHDDYVTALEAEPATAHPWGLRPVNSQMPDRAYFFDNRGEFEDKAIFGELTYHISEDWQVTGGFRYFEQEYKGTQEGGLAFGNIQGFYAPTIGAPTTRKTDDEDTLFKLNTSYNVTEDAMLYATWSEGFRRGGANPVPADLPAFSALSSGWLGYEPDEVTNKEVGIKGRLGDFEYTITAFKVEWDKPQLQTTITSLALIGVLNGEEAETEGLEMEFKGYLTDNLLVNFGYTYTNAEITAADTYVHDILDPFGAVSTNQVGQKGDDLPSVPRNIASLSLDYFQKLDSGMEMIYHLGASYRDGTKTTTLPLNNNGIRLSHAELDSITTVDFAATLDARQWKVTLFVDNLTDEEGVAGINPVSYAGTFGEFESVAAPRTIGLSASYTFGE